PGFPLRSDGRHRVVAVPPEDQCAAVAGAARSCRAAHRHVDPAGGQDGLVGVPRRRHVAVRAVCQRLCHAPEPGGLDPAAAAKAADAEHRATGRRQPGDGVDRACRPPGRPRQRAPRLVGERPADLRLSRRPVVRLEAAERRGIFRREQCCCRLFLPAHRSARPACARRTGGVGPRVGKDLAWCGTRQDPQRGRAVRDLLALSSRRLGGALCAARVGRPRAGDLHVGSPVIEEPKPMKMHEVPGTAEMLPPAGAWQRISADVSSDQRAFKNVPWGKPMMWIFLLSDTFIFGSFLISYMTVRASTTVPWPNPSEVFSLTMFGKNVPLLLIAIMTFILISSSGTMALAVNYGYRRDRKTTFVLLLATAALGATFVGMQAFEWTKLILEGVRPWTNPWGAAQFGSSFFMITGFHGTHVTIGVIFLLIVATKVLRGDLDQERPGFLTGRK